MENMSASAESQHGEAEAYAEKRQPNNYAGHPLLGPYIHHISSKCIANVLTNTEPRQLPIAKPGRRKRRCLESCSD